MYLHRFIVNRLTAANHFALTKYIKSSTVEYSGIIYGTLHTMVKKKKQITITLITVIYLPFHFILNKVDWQLLTSTQWMNPVGRRQRSDVQSYSSRNVIVSPNTVSCEPVWPSGKALGW